MFLNFRSYILGITFYFVKSIKQSYNFNYVHLKNIKILKWTLKKYLMNSILSHVELIIYSNETFF
jgi:hypothetical protein